MSTDIYTGARLHAYLVLSPDETQRQNLATHIAKQMLCSYKKDDTFCNKCSDCIKIESGTHPDVIYIGKYTKKVSVSEVRETLEQAFLAPNEAQGKVFILCNADNFNSQSQNALLKIIEEPPKNVKFILTARNKNALLPTVLSRVCIVSPQAQTFEHYVAAVKAKNPSLESENAKSLAMFCMYYETELSETFPQQSVLDAFSLAYDFFSGSEKNPVQFFPTGRETLCFFLQVFMLVAKEITYCAVSQTKKEFVFDVEKISNCCARTSAKKAMLIYEVFQDAYLRTCDGANINAVCAYISQNI